MHLFIKAAVAALLTGGSFGAVVAEKDAPPSAWQIAPDTMSDLSVIVNQVASFHIACIDQAGHCAPRIACKVMNGAGEQGVLFGIVDTNKVSLAATLDRIFFTADASDPGSLTASQDQGGGSPTSVELSPLLMGDFVAEAKIFRRCVETLKLTPGTQSDRNI